MSISAHTVTPQVSAHSCTFFWVGIILPMVRKPQPNMKFTPSPASFLRQPREHHSNQTKQRAKEWKELGTGLCSSLSLSVGFYRNMQTKYNKKGRRWGLWTYFHKHTFRPTYYQNIQFNITLTRTETQSTTLFCGGHSILTQSTSHSQHSKEKEQALHQIALKPVSMSKTKVNPLNL